MGVCPSLCTGEQAIPEPEVRTGSPVQLQSDFNPRSQEQAKGPDPVPQNFNTGNRWGGDDADATFVPPPEDDYIGAPPPASPAAGGGSGGGGGSPGGGGGGATLTEDVILSDLDRAEQEVYGNGFLLFDDNNTGIVPMDHELLRAYIVQNSCFSEVDVDTEFLLAGAESGVSQEAFLIIMRKQFNQEDAATQFLTVSGGDEAIVAPDCRSALTIFGSQKLQVNFTDARWERILDATMWDADALVGLQKWGEYCQKVARIARMYQLGGVA